MILNCSCSNSYQTKVYGLGQRVFNPCKGAGQGMQRYRCTVCKAERDVKAAEALDADGKKSKDGGK